jgi:hypothetical protein
MLPSLSKAGLGHLQTLRSAPSMSALRLKRRHSPTRFSRQLSATSGRRDFGLTHNLRLRCFGCSAPDLHRPFSHSHAGPAGVILTNKFTASALKGGPDRPHCTWPKRLPARKSGNGVRGHLCGAGQITHAPSQCSAGHSALYRQQFVTRFRLLLLIAGHVSIVRCSDGRANAE